jgi:GTPase SAR1 family protein
MTTEILSYSIGLCGPSGKGKTSLIKRLIENSFENEHIPTLEDKLQTMLRVDGYLINITLHDTGLIYN